VPGFGRRLPLALLLALALTGVALLTVPDWPTALVTLVTVPSGCSVTGADGVTWVTPATLPVPREGLRVIIEHRGWVPVDMLLVPSPGDTAWVCLEPLFALSVTSSPPGASVSVDMTEPVSATPCTLYLDRPGGHLVTLESPQGISRCDSVCIISGGMHELHYDLPCRVDPGGGLPEMVMVPAGSYRTGEGCSVVSRPFLMSRFELTNDLFADFLNSVDPAAVSDTLYPAGRTLLLDSIAPCNWFQPVTGSPGEGYTVADGYGDHPVTGLSLAGMEMYCAWLTGSAGDSGPSFRLPSRAEWTVCASAGGSWPWPWGAGRPDGGLLNMSDSAESLMCRCPGLTDGFAFTAPVGSFPANDWGFHDMAGNVWEACSDGTAAGGGWLSDTSDCRIDSSVPIDSGMGYAYIGFRLAADPRPEGSRIR
jgi:formylglycine-generating enzyme required for sulfatase activity